MHRTMFSRAALVLLGAFVVSACENDDATAPGAGAIQATSATSTSGLAGQAAPISPTVQVTSGGSPVAGVMVHFAVQQGAGGSVQYANVLTDAGGTASAGTWLLGAYPGTNIVSATVEGLAPVLFTATVAPGPAATATQPGWATQVAEPFAVIGTPLSIQVRDLFGTPVSGVNVTFTVTAGGGTIAGGTTATAATNASGTATVSPWVLGATAGLQTVRATVGSVNVTYSVIACPQTPLVGTSVSGTITNTGCIIDTRFMNIHTIQTTPGQPILIRLTSSAFTPMISVANTAGTIIAEVVGSGGVAELRWFPATVQTLAIRATASPAGSFGAYTLTVNNDAGLVTSCSPLNFAERGFNGGTQAITNTDCLTDGTTPFYAAPYNGTGAYRSDVIRMFLTAGQQVTVRMAPTAGNLDAMIVIFSPTAVRTFTDNSFLGAEQTTYTAATTGIHRIVFTSFAQGTGVPDAWEFGPYTLTTSIP